METRKIPKTILIDIIDLKTDKSVASERLNELESLVHTFGGIAIIKIIQKRGVPDYENYIGKGKVEELRELVKEHKADFLIINNILKPRQLYNLEEIFRENELRVWDRIDLILKIFEKHAVSTEAKLQVNLAQIRHFGPRIYKMGTELTRQEGRTGIRSGQGESNIEVMKRHLRSKEKIILEKLKNYQQVQAGHRQRRTRMNLKTAALIGYTNTGKSSLLNALTNKGVYVADELFATLDTRIGKMFCEGKGEMLISDTIGFIRDLPPSLIQAFKSTLAETINSDLLLHVIDVTDEDIEEKINVVEDILFQLGLSDKPKIYIFNKIDLIDYTKLIHEKYTPPFKDNPNIMGASLHTAKNLGWLSEDQNRKKPGMKISELKKIYHEFSPIFISAHKKFNLKDLKSLIFKKFV